MKKTIFAFSALIIALLVFFQLSKYSYLSGSTSIELIIALVAILFLGIGFYLNKKGSKVQQEETKELDLDKIKDLGISNREYQVLVHISKGLSNKEIGEQLFVSENTVKTHVSNLFLKLNAKRRTQAIQRAKTFNILRV